MYGLVNKGLEDMICLRFGVERWEATRQKAKVTHAYFQSHESYPDQVTYRLVAAASEILGEPVEQILESFGVHWVMHTAPDYYGFLLDAGGRNLRDFLVNLPNLHTRMEMAFPHLTPPMFACRDVGERSMVLRYSSKRPGLVPFVVGLLKGLGQRFSTGVSVTELGEVERNSHDFLVEWEPEVVR